MTLPSVSADSIDLSDPLFWSQSREYRDGAFKTLRDTPGLPFYEEREIEGVLASHPLVAESVAVAWPDELLGERVCVFVALRAGIDPTALTLSDVTDHFAAERVAKFKWPERLEIIDVLPRNPVGKVLKRELRDRIAN